MFYKTFYKKVNITFIDDAGHRCNFISNEGEQLFSLFLQYSNSMGKNINNLSFIYNGQRLDPMMKIKECHFTSNSGVITVFESNNVISI